MTDTGVLVPPTSLPALSSAPAWPVDRSAGDADALANAAHEFEAILLRQMLEGLRGLFDGDSGEDDSFGGDALFDTIESEFARHLSRQGGFGLADALVAGPTGPGTRGAADPAPTDGPRALAPGAVGAAGRRVPGPVSGEPFGSTVTSAFGWRADPLDGSRRFHAGVDVRAAFGVEVPAVRAGHVQFVGEQPGYGLTVVVAHEGGATTRYAHLSALLVRDGEQVTVGQTLGRVGQSGRATGPHLHFEMTQDGRRRDPAAASMELARVRFKE